MYAQEGSSDPGSFYEREIRFAVVMYGGISLAVYMNGVAQELLHLVRSTAGKAAAPGGTPTEPLVGKPGGTEEIYRQVAQLIAREPEKGPVRTRFVIDTISGSSAGGINAVYLAKALANDQNIEGLADLWVREGDIEKLINDAESGRDLENPSIGQQKPPASLLDGRRMYRLLYDALARMDAGASPRRPLVDDLDLFVTSTDLHGVPVSIKLADRDVSESRHRHVFHFKFRGEAGTENTGGVVNDFAGTYNPMLAFAARCTSSFPFAFEPMQFQDIAEVLPAEAFAGQREGSVEERLEVMLAGEWQRFFPQPPPPSAQAGSRSGIDDSKTSFGDGGVLDNKPFGHAIDAVPGRAADRPVTRKLLYVEPSPEHGQGQVSSDPPDALENVVLAAVTLPRKEAIRDDLERVEGRNRLVRRVENFLQYLDGDPAPRKSVPLPGTEEPEETHFAGSGFESLPDSLDDANYLVERLARLGPVYGAYHRLKVADATDELATKLAGLLGYTTESAQFQQLRKTVGDWRDEWFVRPAATPAADRRPTWAKPKPTRHVAHEVVFLAEYTSSYRIRRLRYVRRMADRLLLDEKFRSSLLPERRCPANDTYLPDLLSGIRDVRKTLETELQRFVRASRRFPEPYPAGLERILDVGEKERWRLLDELLQPWRREVVDVARTARVACLEAFGDVVDATLQDCPTDDGNRAARWLLWSYYRDYERYDMVSFPLLYSTDVGEEIAQIEVHRISPEDATSIVDESEGRRKLAGTRFGNFGAFFDESFRRNDLLWGRLDAAERLIAILLPEPEHERHRRDLTDEAHRRILEETFRGVAAGKTGELVVNAWAQDGSRAFSSSESFDRLVEKLRLKRSDVADVLDEAVKKSLQPQDLLDHYKAHFTRPAAVDTEVALRSAARSTAVVGDMLSAIGRQRADASTTVLGKLGAWLARIGTWFLRLVEASIHDSLWYRVVRLWLPLLYLFEVLMLAGGALFVQPVLTRFGATALAVTLAFNVVWLWLGDIMRGRGRLLKLVQAVIALGVVGLIVLGVWKLIELLPLV